MVVCLTLVIVVSCKKDSDELSLKRQFSPSLVTSKNGETSVELTWAASLFTISGDVEYVVEVSPDPAFGAVEYSVTTPNLTTTISDDKLTIKKDYYARIKAVGKNGATDSNWLVSSAFRITGEQFLIAINSTTVTDVAVQLTWRLNPDLNKLVFTPPVGAPVEYTLTAGEKAAGLKVITGLTQSTTYSAEIFQDTKSKGLISFKTKASITGNIVDLTGTTGDPNALITALGTAASGSIIVLRRGETYKFTSFTFTGGKSVSIVTALGFGTDYAIIRSTGSFTIAASTTTDSLVFRDLIIKGQNVATAPLSYDNHYLFNVGNTNVNVTKMRFDNCNIRILRGLVRGQAGTPASPVTNPPTVPSLVVTNYIINNCVMDSIREYGIASTFNTSGSSFKNITVTNSTFSHFRKFIDHRVYGNLSINISNCTFFDVVAGAAAPANAFIDFQTVGAGIVNISNCIFGRTWNETGAGTLVWGFRASTGSPGGAGSYGTSDFVNDNLPISVTSYAGTSLSLFTDPVNDNFKIKDVTFVGRSIAGDPRWRIN